MPPEGVTVTRMFSHLIIFNSKPTPAHSRSFSSPFLLPYLVLESREYHKLNVKHNLFSLLKLGRCKIKLHFLQLNNESSEPLVCLFAFGLFLFFRFCFVERKVISFVEEVNSDVFSLFQKRDNLN